MRQRLRTVPAVALAALVAAAPLHAQAFGRLLLTVQDEEGKAVEGVKVTATCPELAHFHQEATSDDKGRVQFTVVDATHTFHFTFEHDGFQTAEVDVKPKIRDTTRQDVTLVRSGSGAAPPLPPPGEPGLSTPSLSPAQGTFNQGLTALQAGDLATAEGKFQTAVKLDPKLAPAYAGLAAIYLQQQKWDEALAVADRLLALEPDNPRGLRARYEAHKALGHDKEAKEAFRALSALQSKGDAAAITYNEGVEALRKGDNATAVARFEDALVLQPDLAPALSALAILSFNAQQYARAAELAEKVLAVDADNLQAKKIRYDSYRLLGDAAHEQEAFAALAAADPKALAKDLYEAGAKLFDAGQIEQATHLLEQALEADPENADALYRLGLCYVNQNQPAKAKELFEKFLAVAPDHPEAANAREMLSYLKP
jgi:tetratricopeptide (TPR) repeat protein